MKKKLIGKRLTFSGKVYYEVENGELEYSGYIIQSIISGSNIKCENK